MKTMTRPRVPDEDDFTSWLRSPAVTARIGLWLGICFGLAFVTGLVSHWAQTPSTRGCRSRPARAGATG